MKLYHRQPDLTDPRLALLGCLLLFYFIWVRITVWTAPHVPQFAYATFLTESYAADGAASALQDDYFLGVRVLLHRLLYSEARTKYSVVVMVTDDVSKEKRRRLEKDGAKVVVVSPIEMEPWAKPNEPRWHSMMTKLKLFDLTDYDMLCYIDADTLIKANLDLVFETEAVKEQKTRDSADLQEDEAPLPDTYVMAAHPDNFGYEHSFARPDYLNAGFLVFRPSRVLYDYYISVSKIEDRYKTGMMEQDLLNYAHRPHGNMPWQGLWENWNIDHPVEADFEKGLSFHDKYWEPSSERQPHFVAMWEKHVAEMKSYWGET